MHACVICAPGGGAQSAHHLSVLACDLPACLSCVQIWLSRSSSQLVGVHRRGWLLTTSNTDRRRRRRLSRGGGRKGGPLHAHTRLGPRNWRMRNRRRHCDLRRLELRPFNAGHPATVPAPTWRTGRCCMCVLYVSLLYSVLHVKVRSTCVNGAHRAAACTEHRSALARPLRAWRAWQACRPALLRMARRSLRFTSPSSAPGRRPRP